MNTRSYEKGRKERRLIENRVIGNQETAMTDNTIKKNCN